MIPIVSVLTKWIMYMTEVGKRIITFDNLFSLKYNEI